MKYEDLPYGLQWLRWTRCQLIVPKTGRSKVISPFDIELNSWILKYGYSFAWIRKDNLGTANIIPLKSKMFPKLPFDENGIIEWHHLVLCKIRNFEGPFIVNIIKILFSKFFRSIWEKINNLSKWKENNDVEGNTIWDDCVGFTEKEEEIKIAPFSDITEDLLPVINNDEPNISFSEYWYKDEQQSDRIWGDVFKSIDRLNEGALELPSFHRWPEFMLYRLKERHPVILDELMKEIEEKKRTYREYEEWSK